MEDLQMENIGKLLTSKWHYVATQVQETAAIMKADIGVDSWALHLIVFCTFYGIFTLCSVAHLLFSERMRVKRKASVVLLIKLRILISLCLASCPSVYIVGQSPKEEMFWVNFMAAAFMMFGWLAHQQYLRGLEEYFPISYRGHKIVIFSWFLTILALMEQSSFLLTSCSSSGITFDLGVIVMAWLLQVAYLLTLVCTVAPHKAYPAVKKEKQPRFVFLRACFQHVVTYVSIAWRIVQNYVSDLTLGWVNPFIEKGSFSELRASSDLLELPLTLTTRCVSDEISKQADQLSYTVTYYEGIPGDIPDTPRIKRKYVPLSDILMKCYGFEYFFLGLLKLAADLTAFACPVFLNKFLEFLELDKATHKEYIHGVILATALCCTTLATGLFTAHFNYRVTEVALKLRATVITSVYKKMLTTPLCYISYVNLGEIMNFISIDTDRLQNFCPNFHNLWSLPLQVSVCVYLLYLQVEFASLCGIVFGIVVLLINFSIANKIHHITTAMTNQKDTRVKMMSEAVFGIQSIKFCAWERHFLKWILGVRYHEVASLSKKKNLDAICVYFWATSTVLISFLTFFTYTYVLHKTLTTAKVFTSLALFNILLLPLNVLPWTISGLMDAGASLKRLERILKLPNLDPETYYAKIIDIGKRQELMQIVNAVFVWQDSEQSKVDAYSKSHSTKQFVLGPLNLDIYSAQFIGIFGKVGSGKSSIIQALMGEMCKKEGLIALATTVESFGYIGQEFWLQQGTIRENILFGSPFDKMRYSAVLDACALEEDLKRFPAGDGYFVKDRGVNLSGGQRARIALARAVYQNKKIYLLDDPFAGLDTHYAHYVFNVCIKKLLANTTRILCTHNMNFLYQTDYVLVLQDGKVIERGPPAAVFAAKSSSRLFSLSSISKLPAHKVESAANEVSKKLRVPVFLDTSYTSRTEFDLESKPSWWEETIEQGPVNFVAYKQYWSAVGSMLAPIILCVFTVMQASRNITDWWLAYWLASFSETANMSRVGMSRTAMLPLSPETAALRDINGYNVYVQRVVTVMANTSTVTSSDSSDSFEGLSAFFVVYALLVAVNSAFVLSRAFLFAHGGVVAAIGIHDKLLWKCFKAPMSFFDTTPASRLLNRFSIDVGAVDDKIPFMMNIFLTQLFGLIGVLAISCYGLPWLLVLILPLTYGYFKLQNDYLLTARAVKRICATTLSPLYSCFSETFRGLVTIRALKAEKRSFEKLATCLDQNQRASFTNQVVIVWLSLRLHFIGVAVVVALSVLALAQSFPGFPLHDVFPPPVDETPPVNETQPTGEEEPVGDTPLIETFPFICHFLTITEGLVKKALICLIITYALAITNMLNNFVWSFTETEKEMISCERIFEFIDNMGSESWVGTIKPETGWPRDGALHFRHVTMLYTRDKLMALKNVSFRVFPGERLGIVGRTGAGKSSLFRALFRLEELTTGQICVDGMDIQTLSLEELRKCMSCVPQHPFVFSGTIRENIDPDRMYSSYDLWNVLEKCRIVDIVHRIGGLDAELQSEGIELSLGQKQLLCLSRALLMGAQILCIDEIAGRLDHNTDELIHDVIDTVFSGKTVLLISHRIESVLKCQRVMVMKCGEIVELDNPHKLLARETSEFFHLAQKAAGGYSRSSYDRVRFAEVRSTFA